MDPVTQRLVDAALAWDDMPGICMTPVGKELEAAVAAYRHANRPLMERLPDLQKGATVKSSNGVNYAVLANVPERKILIVNDGPDDWSWFRYSSVAAIVSEAP